MKTSGLFLAALLLAGAPLAALSQDESGGKKGYAVMADFRAFDACRHVNSLLQSLDYDNQGVVESAIRMAIFVKLAQPEFSCPDVEETLARLAREGATETIRLKASLAAIVYAQPTLFSEEAKWDYALDDSVFRAVAARVGVAMAARFE